MAAAHDSDFFTIYILYFLKVLSKWIIAKSFYNLKHVCGRIARMNVVISLWALICVISIGIVKERIKGSNMSFSEFDTLQYAMHACYIYIPVYKPTLKYPEVTPKPIFKFIKQ